MIIFHNLQSHLLKVKLYTHLLKSVSVSASLRVLNKGYNVSLHNKKVSLSYTTARDLGCIQKAMGTHVFRGTLINKTGNILS